MKDMLSGRIRYVAGPEDFAEIFDVSRETLEGLIVYEKLLRRWQGVKNLVAPETLDQIWHRHFADSAQLLFHAQVPGVWLDLGTGAGFPGMILAILLKNDSRTRVHLVEGNKRKCAFLRDLARRTNVSVEIHSERIEHLAERRTVTSVDFVTARALAPLSALLDYAAPFCTPATTALFLKGRNANEEVQAAAASRPFRHALHPSLTEEGGRVVEITELRRPTG